MSMHDYAMKHEPPTIKLHGAEKVDMDVLSEDALDVVRDQMRAAFPDAIIGQKAIDRPLDTDISEDALEEVMIEVAPWEPDVDAWQSLHDCMASTTPPYGTVMRDEEGVDRVWTGKGWLDKGAFDATK